MIDIDDLYNMEICEKCNVAFFPENRGSSIRQKYCKRCINELEK